MELLSVDINNEEHLKFLYQLFKERYLDSFINIVETDLPSYEKHVYFWKSTDKTYFIVSNKETLCAMTHRHKDGEIGVFVLKKYHRQGIGSWAIQKMIDLDRLNAVYARVNPNNYKSNSMLESLGFNHTKNVGFNYVENIWRLND